LECDSGSLMDWLKSKKNIQENKEQFDIMPLRRSGIIMNIVLKHAYAQICLLRIKLYAF